MKILPYRRPELQGKELTITFKPQVTSKIEAIAEEEGTDPMCQVMLAVARFINERWNWKENRPMQRGEG